MTHFRREGSAPISRLASMFRKIQIRPQKNGYAAHMTAELGPIHGANVLPQGEIGIKSCGFSSVGVLVCGFLLESSDPHDMAVAWWSPVFLAERRKSICRATVALTTCSNSAAVRALLADVLQELRNGCSGSASGQR